MKLIRGDVMSALGTVDILLVTGNSTINKSGKLCMGAGAAKALRDRFPDAADEAASLLLRASGSSYYAMWWPSRDREGREFTIGLFQTKHSWRSPSDLATIRASTWFLARQVTYQNRLTFALNFPGIGLGGLRREDVLGVISSLPDNVEIWEMEAQSNG